MKCRKEQSAASRANADRAKLKVSITKSLMFSPTAQHRVLHTMHTGGWKREGRRVRIARPPQGMDFNDLLTGRASSIEEEVR
jgi:hypothetical protein